MKEVLELLLLEDSQDDADLVLRALRKSGLQVNVRRVQTRETFQKAMDDGGWDLVLSDFNLPGFNGREALELFRTHDPETPFILVSGEIGEERAAELMRHGANDFVRKDRLERLAPAIERELREYALRRSHQEAMARLLRLGQALEQSGDEVVMADAEGRITYVNPAFTASTGFSLAEATGRHPLALLGDPLDIELHEVLLGSIRDSGTWQGRFRGRKKDGEVILLESRITAIRNDQGAVAGFIGTHRDVTRQVELELHMEQAQRLEAIGTLAGGIAHDFNNLLMAIRGFAEIAKLRSGEPKLASSLDGILQATDRARDLVQQILAFSRSKAGERKPVAVEGVLNEAMRFIRASVPSSITIRLHVSSAVAVLADPSELQRIIVNLCTNGVLAMRGGTGLLTVDLDEIAIDDSRPPLGAGRYARLRVADNGCGMAPEVMARVFEPFFTTRPTTGGTGMGLSVVHGLVNSMNGLISVESTPGQGTLFEVLLPAYALVAEAAGAKQPELEHGRGCILWVDDEPMLCAQSSEMLRDLGYSATTCTDPMEAFLLFKRDPMAFDLVVTDMTMPTLTGDRLAEKLLALRPDLPIVLCTGFSEKIDAARASRIGIVELVHKPFEWSHLSAILRQHVGRMASHG